MIVGNAYSINKWISLSCAHKRFLVFPSNLWWHNIHLLIFNYVAQGWAQWPLMAACYSHGPKLRCFKTKISGLMEIGSESFLNANIRYVPFHWLEEKIEEIFYCSKEEVVILKSLAND